MKNMVILDGYDSISFFYGKIEVKETKSVNSIIDIIGVSPLWLEGLKNTLKIKKNWDKK